MIQWLKQKFSQDKIKNLNESLVILSSSSKETTWENEKHISQELAQSFSEVSTKEDIEQRICKTLKNSHQAGQYIQFSKFTMDDIIFYLEKKGYIDFSIDNLSLNNEEEKINMREERKTLKKVINSEYYEVVKLGFDYDGYHVLNKQTIQNSTYI